MRWKRRSRAYAFLYAQEDWAVIRHRSCFVARALLLFFILHSSRLCEWPGERRSLVQKEVAVGFLANAYLQGRRRRRHHRAFYVTKGYAGNRSGYRTSVDACSIRDVIKGRCVGVLPNDVCVLFAVTKRAMLGRRRRVRLPRGTFSGRAEENTPKWQAESTATGREVRKARF